MGKQDLWYLASMWRFLRKIFYKEYTEGRTQGDDRGKMVLCRGFFMASFFLPSWYFGNLKPKSVILNYQIREAHLPIPSRISSPCLYRAVASYSVLGEIWLLFSSYSIRIVHFLAYSPPPPCCWKHIPAWQRSVLLPAVELNHGYLLDLDCQASTFPYLMTWGRTCSPLPPNISRPFQSRPVGRNTKVGCSSCYIPLHHCQIPETVDGLRVIFRALRKVFTG